MPKRRILIFSPLWAPRQTNEAIANVTKAMATLLAERDDVRPIVFTKATISPPCQLFRQGGVLYIVANRRWPPQFIKLLGWLTASIYAPHLAFFLNRHALALLPAQAIVKLANVAVAYIGESILSAAEVRSLKVMRQVYIENPTLKSLLAQATVCPMGTDLRPFVFSNPTPPPPWRICFASSPLPWHEPEEVEMMYLKSRGVLDTLRLVEAMNHALPVHLTLLWRKEPYLIKRLIADLPFVEVKTGFIADMNTFLNQFHFYAAFFRPREERFYKPLPNSVVEAMAKGIPPLAYAGTLIGQRIGAVSSDLLLFPAQDLRPQAKNLANRLPALFSAEIRSAIRQEALKLDLSHFVSCLLELNG